MKKILPTLVLSIALLVPMIATAQVSPPECCRIGQTLSRTSGQITTSAGTVTCTSAAPCSLVAGTFVGQTLNATCQTGTVSTAGNQWGLICVMNSIYTVTN